MAHKAKHYRKACHVEVMRMFPDDSAAERCTKVRSDGEYSALRVNVQDAPPHHALPRRDCRK